MGKQQEVYGSIADMSQTIIWQTLNHLNLNRLTNNTGNAGTVNVEIVVPLQYLSNFWNAFNQLWN